jgi:hypothetical protein
MSNGSREIEKLRKEVEKLRAEVEELINMKSAKKPKKPRKPSSFNIFMKNEIPNIKKKNPKLSHMEAFKKAAENWKAKNNK